MTAHRHVAPSGQHDADGGRARGAKLRATVGLAVVGLSAGLLFSTSASLAADSAAERRPETLRDLIGVEADRLADTNGDVVEMREEVATLLDEQSDPAAVDEDVAFAAGTTAVTGPGLVVRVWDAPTPVQLPEGTSLDDLVVHQQDLESVMNGLWAGGAEAMTVQGHRVTATSSVRCVGNVLLIDGATYSPPYEVAAIGDPQTLEDSLYASPSIQIYLQYVDALNLGWAVSQESELAMPADETNLAMEYAVVPG